MLNKEDFKKRILNLSFNFSLDLIRLISVLHKNNIIITISDQLLRSGFSIGANIAEAQGAASKNDFRNFIHYAYKSAIETRYWLAILDKGNLVQNNVELYKLIEKAKELNKILSSIILTLKGKKTINS